MQVKAAAEQEADSDKDLKELKEFIDTEEGEVTAVAHSSCCMLLYRPIACTTSTDNPI